MNSDSDEEYNPTEETKEDEYVYTEIVNFVERFKEYTQFYAQLDFGSKIYSGKESYKKIVEFVESL